MRKGLNKFIEHIRERKYSFGEHEQAEKDYKLICYILKNTDNMTDDRIFKTLADYGCPQPLDTNVNFDTVIWCDKILKCEECDSSDPKCMDETCPQCWKAFLKAFED